MKLFVKITALFTVLSLFVSLTGCFDYSYIDETADSITTTQQQDNIISKDEIRLNLPYISSDSLDPFAARSEINQSLTSLMFDSLFSVNNEYKAVPLLAESYSVNNNKLTVTIHNNIIFSDSSNMSANDVVISFETAKKSNRYKSSLTEINGAVSTGTYTVVFDVTSNSDDVCSLLTFPIFKTGSEIKNDNKTETPTGSGRYILSESVNNELYLTANQNHISKKSPVYKNIGLIAATDEDAAASTFSLGHTNVLIDSYSDGVYQKYIGASTKHNIANIVYLVCNPKNKALQDSDVKKAISYAIDREDIANYSFISYAKAAYTPFHPDYYKLKDIDILSFEYNETLANTILDSIGYNNINPQYKFRYSEGKILEFSLAVNKDNPFKLSAAQKIKDQLKKVNIIVNLRLYSQEDFVKAVKNGSYDLYLGECKLTDSLDLSVFFDSGNSASIGISSENEIESVYSDYKNGLIGIEEFVNKFNSTLPFIPILYRCASINSNSGMAISNISIVSDCYNNIDKWKSVND